MCGRISVGSSRTPATARKHVWLSVTAVVVACFAYSIWRIYDLDCAEKEAVSLGLKWKQAGPLYRIKKDWRAAFQKDTWTFDVRTIDVRDVAEFQQNIRLIHRLDPRAIVIRDASALTDLRAFADFSKVTWITLANCDNLTDIASLTSLKKLSFLQLNGCKKLGTLNDLSRLPALGELQLADNTFISALTPLVSLPNLKRLLLVGFTAVTSVDSLKKLQAAEFIQLSGCSGISNDAFKDLKAARPDTGIVPS